jgi:hypothetical protein
MSDTCTTVIRWHARNMRLFRCPQRPVSGPIRSPTVRRPEDRDRGRLGAGSIILRHDRAEPLRDPAHCKLALRWAPARGGGKPERQAKPGDDLQEVGGARLERDGPGGEECVALPVACGKEHRWIQRGPDVFRDQPNAACIVYPGQRPKELARHNMPQVEAGSCAGRVAQRPAIYERAVKIKDDGVEGQGNGAESANCPVCGADARPWRFPSRSSATRKR